LIAQGGVGVSLRRLENSSIEESIVSITIVWLRRQSLREGQKISTAVGIQPCGAGALSTPAV
jgi:hypothetical protein